MESISPLVGEAYRLFHLDLFVHLEEVEYLADRCDGWSEEDTYTAGELLADLSYTVRTVLGKHLARADGRCRTCGSAWPCPVVAAIHDRLKSPDHGFVALLGHAVAARARIG